MIALFGCIAAKVYEARVPSVTFYLIHPLKTQTRANVRDFKLNSDCLYDQEMCD